MFGCDSAATAKASRSNLARASGSAASDCGRTLTATSRFNFESRARYTSPIPPAPERRDDLVGPEARAGRQRHLPPATSFWNRGFLRSGSKLGSIFSQPGERKYGIFSSCLEVVERLLVLPDVDVDPRRAGAG